MKELERALGVSGLSQAAFAAALGTSASRFSTYRRGTTVPSAAFFLRAKRIANDLQAAARRGWVSPPVAMEAIADALDEGDEIWAYKIALQMRDHLRESLAAGPTLAGAWDAAPGISSHPEWRVLLAALVAHEFQSAGEDAPRWTWGSRADQDWVLGSPLMSDQAVRRATPSWLAERRIFVAERDLLTA